MQREAQRHLGSVGLAAFGVACLLLSSCSGRIGRDPSADPRGARVEPPRPVEQRPGEDAGAITPDPRQDSGVVDAGQLPQPVPPAARPNLRSPLGTNLFAIADWSSEWVFVDAFKASRSWISGHTDGTWDDRRPLDLDELGWVRSLGPEQVARTLILSNLEHPPPGGEYVVLFDGEGTLEFTGGAALASSGPGRHVVRVDPSRGGVFLHVTSTAPENHLRNIRVLMPGGACEESQTTWCDADSACSGRCVPFEESYQRQIFHPVFLDRVQHYANVRFMDWMDTNHSTIRRWDERPRFEHARWGERGVPLEIMLNLANRLGMDPWFTLPHLADDEYVERFARQVHEQLAPGLKAYVEYSNEVWNGMFPQATHAREQGRARGFGPSDFEAQLQYYALRTGEIVDIWDRVFEGDRSRLVRVAGTQVGQHTWVSEQILGFQGLGQRIDALAVAPYFGGQYGNEDQLARVEQLGPDGILSDIEARDLDDVALWVRVHAELTRRLGMRLIAYEGGQHLVGVGGMVASERMNQIFDAANRSPRMKEIYLRYLQIWRQEGGELFAHFVNCTHQSQWGRWGALEWIGQPRAEAPKYDALMEFIEKNPRWWKDVAQE